VCRQPRLKNQRVPGGHLCFVAAVAVVCFAWMCLPGTAAAAPGDPDPSFGNGGTVIVDNGSPYPTAEVAIDSQDRIVSGQSVNVNGSNVNQGLMAEVLRVRPDGTPDPGFSGDGIAEVPGLTHIYALAIDKLDRILVAGYYYNSIDDPSDTNVVRLSAKGEIDTTFADNGYRDLGDKLWVPSMLAKPDGGVLLATVDPRVLFTAEGGPTSEYLVLRQLTSAGADDAGFGNGGTALFHMGSGTVRSEALDLASAGADQAVLLGRYPSSSSSYRDVVIRVQGDGTPDRTFNGGGVYPSGIVTLDPPWSGNTAIAVDGSGRVLLAGGEHVNRLTSGGLPDGAFGSGGQVKLGVPSQDLDLHPNGKLVASGWTGSEGDGSWRFVATQLTDSGAVDAGFGQNGSISFFGGDGASLAIDSLGRIVVVDAAYRQEGGTVISRFLDDPVVGGNPASPGSPGSDSGSGGVAGAVATSARNVHVHKVVVPRSRAALGSLGVRVLASCDEDCRIVLEVEVSKAVAKAMGLKSTVLASGSVLAKAGERHWVLAKLTPGARRALRRYDGAGRLHVNVTGVSP
jgi:uncharacterized delta-60 repeat protein